MAVTLKQKVIESVTPVEYYDWYFSRSGDTTNLVWPSRGSDARVSAPDRDDRRPSMYLNPKDGSWYDHGGDGGEGSGGGNIVSFHARFEGVSHHDAATQIFHEFIHPVIDPRKIRRWARTLSKQRQAHNYLNTKRRLTDATIEKYKLGWDGDRIVFPITNEFGLYVNAKLYDPMAARRKMPKMLNYTEPGEERKYGSPATLYPWSSIKRAHEEGYVVVCEGEWDALFLNQLGIPSVTSTAGAKAWARSFNELFHNLEVILCLDNDPTGIRAAKKINKELLKNARSTKIVRVPKKYGKDVLDWANHSPIMRKAKGWLKRFDSAEVTAQNTDDYLEKKNKTNVQDTNLDVARAHDRIGKMMRIKAIIAGKATDPLTVPLKYRIVCQDPSLDKDCPLNSMSKDYLEGQVDPQSEFMFDLLSKRKTQVNATLMKRHGFDPRSDAKPSVEVLQYASFEEIRVQPSFDVDDCEHVTAQAYCLGLGLRANQTYYFTGTSYPSEICNITKMMFTEVEPAQSQAETFKITSAVIDDLKVFKPKNSTKKGVIRKLYSVAEWQSRNITKIKERPDLHIACDLVFHSVNSFNFNGEHVHRGMLDVIIIGDTRCGKGYVAEGLQKYYRAGEVASGENCTFAGLVGGVQQLGKQWFVTWGVIPMNHNRLVVIDEASAIPAQGGFGRLSRVRSEGVAEITKIVRESAMAKARLLWLSNPLTGRPIMSYPSGVHAIKELVSANEDISRFDFALTVAADEVDTEVINEVRGQDDSTSDANRYPQYSAKSLVMWAWSRKPDQIIFTSSATREIIKSAIVFGKKYSSTIPLVQSENIRVKIAKISASIAAKVFSCDHTGEMLVIGKEHVQAACFLLDLFYSKPSMAYDTFSRKDTYDKRMKSTDEVQAIFDGIRENSGIEVMRFLAGHTIFTSDALNDILPAEEDPREIIRKLVLAKCIERSSTKSWYKQTLEFRKWISSKQKEMGHE